ncbi:MAG TPA: hypothetical protein VGI11_16055 [Variovorax sp.]
MDFPRPRFLALCLHAAAPWLLAAAASTAAAQQADNSQFPAAAVGFLSQELPQMETAIKERDGDYFRDATSRMLDFSESWGFKTHENPALANYAVCTEPVSDFLVVGMCRILPTSDACEPGLPARFTSNLQKCREIAARQ